jgi:hypothetical protein
MKKIISVSVSVLAPFMVFANLTPITTSIETTSNVMCVQVTQAAINAQGECKNFSTPCNVPNDWKKVSSCENFENTKEKRTSIAENTERRYNNKWIKLREKSRKTLNKPTNSTSKQKVFLRQSRKFVKNNKNRIKNLLDRKSNTRKNWNSSFRKRVSPARQKMIDQKQKLQKIKNDSKRRNLRHQVQGSATKMNRSGKLSNKFWTTQEKSRKKYSKIDSETIKKGLRSRQPFRKAKPKKINREKHAKLRRSYRKSSIGNLAE